MSKKTYLYILQVGVYVSLISVFLVFKNLLFPFITSKQIFFNVLMEILTIFWIAMIVKYPEYRPKKNFITFGLVAFFAALLVTCFTSVDFNLSFWGDIERMLGVFHLLHFLAFYFILITAFRKRLDWQILFSLSTFFAIILSIDLWSGGSNYATVGNPAYVAGYLIFHIYFSLLLFFSVKDSNWRYLFLLGIPFFIPGLRRADISGSYVGFGFSIMIMLMFYGILHKNKRVKVVTGSAFLIATIFVSYVFIINRDNYFTQNYPLVYNLVREVDVSKNTFQTRLISWRAGLRQFPEHPLVGTGHGNFAITFDKGFDPSFYDQTRGETYFDRAHNNVIDILSTTGLLGLTTYMSILLALAFYLVQGYRRGKISQNEFIMLSCLIVAYFVQNLAVFDSLVTYMGLMITLAYAYWLYERPEQDDETPNAPLSNKEIYTLAVAGIVLLTIAYQYNIKVYKMLDATIAGQRAYASGNLEATIDEYKKALAYNTPLDRDSRTSLNRIFVSNPGVLSGVSKEKALEVIDYNIELAKANVEYNKGDSLNQMILAQLYNVAAANVKDNQEKFAYYSEQALSAINASIDASPGRIPIYFQKSQVYLTRGDKDNAIKTLREATELSDTYYDSFCHLGRTLLYFKDESGWEAVSQCIDKGGINILNDVNLIKTYINYYVEAGDWERTLKLYEGLVRSNPEDVENLIKLAKLYDQLGDIEKAKETAEKAIEVNPGIASYAQEFINNLEKTPLSTSTVNTEQ